MGNLPKWKEREAVAIAIAVAACRTSSYQSSWCLSNSCSCSPKSLRWRNPFCLNAHPQTTLFSLAESWTRSIRYISQTPYLQEVFGMLLGGCSLSLNFRRVRSSGECNWCCLCGHFFSLLVFWDHYVRWFFSSHVAVSFYRCTLFFVSSVACLVWTLIWFMISFAN